MSMSNIANHMSSARSHSETPADFNLSEGQNNARLARLRMREDSVASPECDEQGIANVDQRCTSAKQRLFVTVSVKYCGRDCILTLASVPSHTAFDVDMLALHSGLERDERMWQRLVSKAGGLSNRKFWHPPDCEGEGIVEVVRSDENGG